MRIVLAKVLVVTPKMNPKERVRAKVRERKEKVLHGKANLMKFMMHHMMIGGGMNRIGDLTPMMALLIKFMVGMTLIGKMNRGMKVGQVTLGNSMRLRSPVLSLIWIPVRPRKRNQRKKSQWEV